MPSSRDYLAKKHIAFNNAEINKRQSKFGRSSLVEAKTKGKKPRLTDYKGILVDPVIYSHFIEVIRLEKKKIYPTIEAVFKKYVEEARVRIRAKKQLEAEVK